MTPSPGAGVVLERELLRTSRRWQTAGLRAGYALVMLLVIGFAWRDRVLDVLAWDPSALSRAGRYIFEGYTVVQSMMLVLLTPILVAQAIIEERNAGTLRLLAITRLTPRRLLVGKLASRLVVLEAIILAGLPFLALCLSLGGVEPAQVLNVFLQANAMLLGLASVSAFVALYARGPILPAMAAWAWAFAAWLPATLPMVVWRGDEDDAAWISPIAALVEGRGIEMLGPLFVSGVVAAFCLALSSRVFATLAGGDAEGEYLSADVWAVERIARRIGLLTAMLFVALPPLGIIWAFAHRSHLGGPDVAWFPFFAWNVLAIVAGTGGMLFGVRKALRWVGGRRERFVGWREELAAWQTEGPPALARGRSLSQHEPGEGGRTRAHRPRNLRPIWGNPVAWREVMTDIHGGFSRWIGKLYIVALVLLLLLTLLPGFARDPDGPMFFAWCALGVAWVATALAAASSASGELRARSLALLVTTRMTPSAIVGGKVAGVAVLAAPPLLASIALLVGGVGFYSAEYRWAWEDNLFDPQQLMVRWAGMSAYAIAVTGWFAVSNVWLGLQAKTPGRAWVTSLVHVGVWTFAPAITMLVFEGNDAIESLVRLLNPALDPAFWNETAIKPGVWVSAGLWVVLAVAAFGNATATLAKRAAR